MKIAVASDHAGLELKNDLIEVLKSRGIEFEDFGTHTSESVDYPNFGHLVGKKVASGEFEKGLLVCGTGLGISIAAGKVKGIRACVCSDTFTAKMSREHNDANVLSLGARVVGKGLATDILNIWLNTDFDGGRHQRRVDMLSAIEDEEYSK